jgi:superfamily I DNA/RNA helicase
MHRAKGLEFKAVAIVGCEAELLPMRSVLDNIPDAADRQQFEEQERNLLYVALTRAREQLLVTHIRELTSFLSGEG